MEYGETIVHDRQRLEFTLYLQHKQGTQVPSSNGVVNVANGGYRWTINWRALINQDLPIGSKFRVTHRFFDQADEIANVGDFRPSIMLVQYGLPGVQTALAYKDAPIGGQPINIAEQRQTLWNGATYYGRYVSDPASFVCGLPALTTSDFVIMFYDVACGVDGAGNTIQKPVGIDDDGSHILTFELVSDA